MSDKKSTNIRTISNAEYLRELLREGYTLLGPRKDQEKDMVMIERYFTKGYEFFPETKLIAEGYKIVEPSTFTKGLQFAYQTDINMLDKYYKSNYSLKKQLAEIPLYLKYEDKEL